MYRIPDEDEVTKNKKMWKGYIPVYGGIKQFRIMATAGFMKDNVRTLIEKKKDGPTFKKAIKLLNTDHHFYEMCGEMSMLGYAGIYVANATSISSAPSTYSLDNVNFMNSQKVNSNCKYVHTTLDLSYDSFVQAIAKNNFNKNECCMNYNIDSYCDSLMDEQKKKRSYQSQIIINYW